MKKLLKPACIACTLTLTLPVFGQNVGINTDGSVPGMMLDVKPTGASDGIRINNVNGGSGDPIIDFQLGSTSFFVFGIDDSDSDRLKIGDGGTIDTAPFLSIEDAGSTGNIGINTNDPTVVLDITVTGASNGIEINNTTGTGDAIIRFQNAGTNEWTIGFDDDDGDRFKIDDNTNLSSTTPAFVVEDNGTTGSVGININNPNNQLDVVGNAQVSEYLLVGNPGVPQTVTPNNGTIELYGWSGNMYYSGWSQVDVCGANIWSATATGASVQDQGTVEWDNAGAGRSRDQLHTPWIYVPSNVADIFVEINHYNSLENGFDGGYIQYCTDGTGTTWTTVPNGSYFIGGYDFTGNYGANTACSGAQNSFFWSGNAAIPSPSVFQLTVSGTWIQFRFDASEDNTVGTGVWQLYGLSVFSDSYAGSYGGAFATGNIYAENNIYAGSNVMHGDVAEHFPIMGSSEPGDLIAMIPGEEERYMTNAVKKNTNIIGIHSTAPTVTLNNPNNGVPVALQGRVPVKVTGAAIKKGDYLTSSAKRGYAEKANGPCFVVGRALEDYAGGNGMVSCMVETGWYNPTTSNTQNSGSFTIAGNQKQIRVIDPTVTKESKVFLTMLADPTNRYWISEKADGYFVLNLSDKVDHDLPFDYLIDNAGVAASVEEGVVDNSTITNGGVTAVEQTGNDMPGKFGKFDQDHPALAIVVNAEGNKEYANPKRAERYINSHPVEVPESVIPFNTGEAPPSEVPDPEKAYRWSPEIGLIETTIRPKR
jgi:hypothetical protein